MKNLNNYIGFPLLLVEDELKQNNINYQVVYSNDYKKEFDTYLVVKVEQDREVVKVYVDRFLLNI